MVHENLAHGQSQPIVQYGVYHDLAEFTSLAPAIGGGGWGVWWSGLGLGSGTTV